MRTSIKEMNKRLDEREQIIEQLKIDNQELLEDNIWWQIRFNAVQRDYENLQQKIDQAIEYIKEMQDSCIVFSNIAYKELLEILGDKENE